MNGVRTMPAPVAVVPVTDWRKSGTNEIAPNIAMPARKRVTTAAMTMRLPKSRSGTIGSAAPRSTTPNSTSPVRPSASRLAAGEPRAPAEGGGRRGGRARRPPPHNTSPGPGGAGGGGPPRGAPRPAPGPPPLQDPEQGRGHAGGEGAPARHVHDGPARGARL